MRPIRPRSSRRQRASCSWRQRALGALGTERRVPPVGPDGQRNRSKLRLHAQLLQHRSDLRADRRQRDVVLLGDHLGGLAVHERRQHGLLAIGQRPERGEAAFCFLPLRPHDLEQRVAARGLQHGTTHGCVGEERHEVLQRPRLVEDPDCACFEAQRGPLGFIGAGEHHDRDAHLVELADQREARRRFPSTPSRRARPSGRSSQRLKARRPASRFAPVRHERTRAVAATSSALRRPGGCRRR